MLLAEAFFAGCWWLRFRWLLVPHLGSAGNWWLHFRWQLVASLPLAWLLVARLPLAAGGSASAGCWCLCSAGNWWLHFCWQLVASLPLATRWFAGFFTGLSSQ